MSQLPKHHDPMKNVAQPDSSSRDYNFTKFVRDASRTVSSKFQCETEAEHDRLHLAVGIATEAGEVLNAFTVEGTCRDENNAAEELGDLLWYFSMLVRQYDLAQNWIMAPFTERGMEIMDLESKHNNELLRNLMLHSIDCLDYVAKKNVFYVKPFDLDVFLEKLMPVIANVSALALRINRTPEECMYATIQKLKHRYPDKFTTELAENRDLGAEATALAEALDTKS